MRASRRPLLTALVAIGVVAAACSDSGDGGADPIDVESLRLGDVEVVSDDVRALQSGISPDGLSVISLGSADDGEPGVCIEAVDPGRPSGCVSVDGRVAVERAGWSDDGEVVFVHSDLLVDFADPDLVRIRIETQDVDVVTDDGVDDAPFDPGGSDDGALGDVSPAFADGGDLLFLRQEAGESDFELRSVAAADVDGSGRAFGDSVVEVEGLDLPVGVVPISGLRPAGPDRWVVLGLDIERFEDAELFVLDLASVTVETYEMRSLDRGVSTRVVDVSPTHALIVDITPLQRLETDAADDMLTLVDLETGDTDRVRLRLTDALPLGAALSPDGTAILVAADGFRDDESEPELLVLPVDESGVGDPVSLDLPSSLPGDGRLFGFGNSIEMGWTDDDRLVAGTDDGLVTIELLIDG